jgi:hypothetical protein
MKSSSELPKQPVPAAKPVAPATSPLPVHLNAEGGEYVPPAEMMAALTAADLQKLHRVETPPPTEKEKVAVHPLPPMTFAGAKDEERVLEGQPRAVLAEVQDVPLQQIHTSIHQAAEKIAVQAGDEYPAEFALQADKFPLVENEDKLWDEENPGAEAPGGIAQAVAALELSAGNTKQNPAKAPAKELSDEALMQTGTFPPVEDVGAAWGGKQAPEATEAYPDEFSLQADKFPLVENENELWDEENPGAGVGANGPRLGDVGHAHLARRKHKLISAQAAAAAMAAAAAKPGAEPVITVGTEECPVCKPETQPDWTAELGPIANATKEVIEEVVADSSTQIPDRK